MFALRVALLRLWIGLLDLTARILPVPKPQVFAGPGSAALLCEAIAASGVKRLLVVSDAALMKLGLFAPLQKRLEAAGVKVEVYDGVEPDPTIAQIENGVSVVKASLAQAVLAFGGGSSMDAAKVIAARATNAKPVAKMTGLLKIRRAPLPLYAIPTTAGTGSEVTVGAVVSDPMAQRKLAVIDPKLVPLMCALDGSLMTGVPAPITAATGMDALTHAVEAYLSRMATPETDAAALEATRLVMRYLPRVYAQGNDVEARQMMSWAAYRAGVAISRAGVGYVHAIAHNFGGRYHTPHGLANAIVLPHVLDFCLPSATQRLAHLAHASGITASGDDTADAKAFIAVVRQLATELDIPSRLKSLRKEDIPGIVRDALSEAHATYGVPRYLQKRQAEALVEGMLPA